MFQLRRTALRLLTSPSTSFIPRSRFITTVAPSALRYSQKPTSIFFQRRWASGEAAEVVESQKKDEEEPPITAEEPAPEDQVEDQIHSDNVLKDSDSPGDVAEAAVSSTESSLSSTESSHSSAADVRTDTDSSVSTPGDESTSKINAAADAVKESVFNTAERVTESARKLTGFSKEKTGSRGFRSDFAARSSSGTLVEPKSTIYVGNLFFDVTEDDLKKELQRFGNITKCRLIRDARGLSKGFGYVDFETIASATQAIETLNQHLFEGRLLAVQYAAYSSRQLDDARTAANRPEKPRNPPSKTLFVGNMSFEMTDRDLNALFRGIKNVVDVRVAIDRRTGQPRGFAHADFIDVTSAMEAMKLLETKETYGRKLRLDYSYGPSNAPRNQPDADMERGMGSEEQED